MRQLAEENVVEAAAADYNLLTDATELELIKKLGEYQEMLELAAKERAVHRVAHYVHDLAGLFHSFYNQCRILGVDPEVQQARIKLVQATRHTCLLYTSMRLADVTQAPGQQRNNCRSA